MNFENNESSLSFEQSQNNYELENQENELIIENNKPQATFENEVNEILFEAPKTKVNMDYNKALNKPSINGVELIDNKTNEDLGIVGTSMTEIEISTDIKNPTEIMNYINKSGTYVAKNAGVIGTNGEPMVVLAKGQFLTISNLQELSLIFGIEIPDSQNIVQIDTRLPDGSYRSFQIIGGTQLKEIAWLTSENVDDYVDIDVTSEISQALRAVINYSYGMQMMGNYVTFVSASNSEIDNANNQYRVITPTNIKYAIQKWGTEYFTTKDAHRELKENVDTLKTEIETILESVVTVDE